MSKSSSPSLVWRAILALALMIGFYALALIIAGGLLYIPYAELTFANRLHIRLALSCVLGAGIILWSILPRPDRFAPPGPRLEPAKHPRLFKELTSIAEAVGQAMPAEVYLVPDVNAWVSYRGGIMGFGSRLMMGLGLPLLQVLTTSQLRAILAHEFGHYYGGDVKLGPWVYKTRAAIERTLRGLAKHSSILQIPFVWYGNMFLRATHAVSRHQEYAADQLAARIVGSQPLVTGLRTIHGAALAFEPFWRNEAVPVLNAGFHPPLADGFARFFHAPSVVEGTSRAIKQESESSKVNPYATHPPLRDRIAAVQDLLPGTEPAEGPLAITLLEDLPQLEGQILALLADEKTAQALKPVSWEEVGVQVYLPRWEALVREQAAALAGVTPSSLPEVSRDLGEFEKRLKKPAGRMLSPDEMNGLAFATVGAALAIAFKKQDWMLHAPPGVAVFLQRGEETIEPFSVLPRLASGELAADLWQQQCMAVGIAEMDLATATSEGQS